MSARFVAAPGAAVTGARMFAQKTSQKYFQNCYTEFDFRSTYHAPSQHRESVLAEPVASRGRIIFMDNPVQAKGPRKSKRERFLAVAQRRTIRVLEAVNRLGKCGNTAAYEYTKSDVEKIFGAIQVELDRARARFSRNSKITFSLGSEEDAP